ncbi:methylenetetrahydrofolate reductase [Paenibacillus baekrokdamisoli]|uniref:Methylenetetrahydrofolate reductase n=1 Tax=Paenibacillus baekrokdamisoli TaxID=1712516 RepID=A0A3G9IVY1_9BACL|nr:methylenetetrahydrofolate reductase [Paenibacillus baekrokdamisoli]MBB3072002.1 methylenetetrahydrofolate reductase (NADPH) [Paenibacillus baekrokdamisoli]BBH20305.1 methylenetetrahydrofolate reductase [Paenibacillus baekrokdamisoli]
MKISVELIPRDIEQLDHELQLIQSSFSEVNTINIPDLLRFSIRSWEGAVRTLPYYENCIPHIRAIDFNLKENLGLLDYLNANNITQVLAVTGDLPQDMNRNVYPTTSVDFIRIIKQECPHIKVYSAIDPYRNNFKEEHEYIQRKLDAGADGFFTQPFFDLRLMEVYYELLGNEDVFWGVSPVISQKSRNYWETKNHAIFPKRFEPTLEWNIDFAREVLNFSRATGTNMYFMPIRVNLEAYLNGVFK